MIDIETLGLEPGCAILSIGAVKFDQDRAGEEFYSSVSLESCQEYGLKVDAGTLEWWLGRDEAVQGVLSGGEDLDTVLEEFAGFVEDADEVWANAPSFDCEILEHAFEAVGIEVPWEFYEERCYRTLKNLPGAVEVLNEGDEHHALDDARHQAERARLTISKYTEREGKADQ